MDGMTNVDETAQAGVAQAAADAGHQQAGPLQALAPIHGVTAASNRRHNGFWVGLAVAVTFHALLLVGLKNAAMRQMGEPDGNPDGISVEVIEDADLAKRMAPQPPSPPQQPPAAAAEQPKLPPAPESRPVPKPEAAADLEKELLELFTPPAPDAKRNDRTASDNSSTQPPMNLNVPPRVLDAPIEFQPNATSMSRPADVTRSGENDDFGRGVIKALRQTMPGPIGLPSRVTIKFLLSERGDVLELQLVRSSGYQLMDQSVVFAARQSSFPIPPRGSKLNDRIFMVTYIYR